MQMYSMHPKYYSVTLVLDQDFVLQWEGGYEVKIYLKKGTPNKEGR